MPEHAAGWSASAEAAELRVTRPRGALAILCAVLFLTFLDTTIVSVALASVQNSLNAGVTQLQWVVNGYALAFASLMLAAGTIADRVGRKRLLLIGLIVFAAGSLLGALATSPTVLIIARVAMGIGAAGSEPGTLSIIRQLYPESTSRSRALGKWAAVSGLALAAGPVIGGALVGVWSWRAVFWFNLAVGVVLVIAAARVLPESRDPVPYRFDYQGLVTVTVSLAAFAFAVIVGETTGYANPGVIALFGLGVVAGAAFIVAEHTSDAPLLDLSYFRLPGFSGALGVAFALFFGIFSIFFFTALYLQVVVNYSGYRTAIEFLPMAASLIASSLIAGRVVAKFGPRAPMTLGAALAGMGTLFSDAIIGHSLHPSNWLILTLAIAGFGFGMGVVPVTSVALSLVPAEHSGMAASATNTSRELGAVFGVAVLGALVNGNLTTQLTAQLHRLGIPSAFQAIVIGAIEHGQVPQNNSSSVAAYGTIVTKVIHAAYGAFRSGLDVALLAAGCAMLAGAVVALFTLDDRRPLLHRSANGAAATPQDVARGRTE